jgi:hypothetical protein
MEGYGGYLSPFSKREKGLRIVQWKMPKLELEGILFFVHLQILSLLITYRHRINTLLLVSGNIAHK